ncbi:MAG: hypothetical protein ABH842_05370 [Candidatus Micrarchaeota archaeon]
MTEEFDARISEARKLESKLLEYAPYKGDSNIENTIDLEPEEFVDYTYQDLVNLYERNKKIISTAAMGILTTEIEEDKVQQIAPPTTEVENKLREMTTETLQTAEEVAKEPDIIDTEMLVETPKQEKIEFEEQKVEEVHKEEEKPERKVIVANVPPALRESPSKSSIERYEKMEDQIRSMVGEAADEHTLKKKMLDLTKQLFKEKTTTKREELKLQITVLKNMLTGTQVKAAKAKKKKEDETYSKLLETMVSAHQTEIAQTKDSIMESYKKQMTEINNKFYHDLQGAGDQAKRKEILESFVFSVTSLAEQLPEVIDKYMNFTMKKHTVELEKIKESLGPDEKTILADIDKRLKSIDKYGEEFSSVKGIVGKEIENMIDAAGTEVFRKPEEKRKEADIRTHEIIKEINETDEGTLLYYLHGRDSEYYKKYEHKQLSKSEAIFKAKELMAMEKGLSANTVRKYFSQKED